MTLIDLLKGNDFSVNVNSMLRNYGDEKIVQLNIGRVELSSALRILLNITSMGEFNKRLAETDTDKLFHLFLYIKTERNNFIRYGFSTDCYHVVLLYNKIVSFCFDIQK